MFKHENIFVCGAYGVGKSYLCESLSKELNIPFYNASDLISKRVNEKYGEKKYVKNKHVNQMVLIEEVNKINKIKGSIILTGHFCIFNKKNKVVKLPKKVFKDLKIRKIILLEGDINIILERISNRDNIQYKKKQIKKLIKSENKYAKKISLKFSFELITCNISDEKDSFVNDIIDFVKE